MEIPLLLRLLTSYAPKNVQASQRLVWAFDQRMADILRSTSEPMIGQIRLTWWHEALSAQAGDKGAGEPLMEALRREVVPGAGAEDLLCCIEGWEVLLEETPLDDRRLIAFAEHRGGGLFRVMGALAGGAPPWLAQAGMAWALWDLAGHMSDDATAGRAMALVPEFLAGIPERGWPKSFAALRILMTLVRQDAKEQRQPPAAISPGQYGRILWEGLAGR